MFAETTGVKIQVKENDGQRFEVEKTHYTRFPPVNPPETIITSTKRSGFQF